MKNVYFIIVILNAADSIFLFELVSRGGDKGAVAANFVMIFINRFFAVRLCTLGETKWRLM